MRWWHYLVKQHEVTTVRVSVPLWDMGAKGLLHRCSCGKTWAQ